MAVLRVAISSQPLLNSFLYCRNDSHNLEKPCSKKRIILVFFLENSKESEIKSCCSRGPKISERSSKQTQFPKKKKKRPKIYCNEKHELEISEELASIPPFVAFDSRVLAERFIAKATCPCERQLVKTTTGK